MSKRSAARAGYFDDEFLGHFVKKPSKRCALINRGYYIRRYAVSKVVTAFAHLHPNGQIVSLGAGFDSLFFTLSKAGLRMGHFFEVDFPHVVANKSLIIQQTPELASMLKGMKLSGEDSDAQRDLVSEHYSLLCADLCQYASLRSKLEHAGLKYDTPTLFLAECVFTYMSNADSDRLIYWAATQNFPLCWFVVYEQIRPYDAFGRTMRENLHVRSSDLLGIDGYPSKEAQYQRYVKMGYADVQIKTMLEVYEGIDAQERHRIDSMEEFDEMEEWREKCSHYTVTIASTKPQQGDQPILNGPTLPTGIMFGQDTSSAPWTEEIVACSGRESELKRWGHSALVTSDGRIIAFAGYGGSARHERQNSIVVIDCTVSPHSVTLPVFTGAVPVARVLHGACMLDDDMMLVFGGRAGPTVSFNDAYLFNCKTYHWQRVAFPVTLPARYRHCLTRIPGTSMAVISGGCSGWKRDQMHSDVWIIDSSSRMGWKVEVEHAEALTRLSHAAIWFNDSLLIHGGLLADGTVLGDAWQIHFSSDFKRAEIKRFEMDLPKRCSHSLQFVEDLLYVIGGCENVHESSIITVNLKERRIVGSHTLHNELFSRAKTAIVSNRLYIVGGGLLCFSFGSSFSDNLIGLTFGGPFNAPVRKAVKGEDTSATVQGKVRKIQRVDNPSEEFFRNWISNVREPCLFSNCGVPKWSKETISKTVAPETLASVHVGETALLDFVNKNYRFEVVPFAIMMDRIDNEKEHLYFRSLGDNPRKDPSNIYQSFPELAKEFTVPKFASSIVTPATMHSSCLRISSADVQMWTHYDINDNILCGVRGRKRLLLWHPEEIRHLYPDGTSSRVLDVEHPDLNQFPKFAKAVAWEGTLEEGDVLFIPAMWWHNVRTLTPCYGVNVFFRHLPEEAYQPNDLYGNKDPVSAVAAQKSLQAAFEALDQLPEEYKAFFGRKMILDIKRHLNF